MSLIIESQHFFVEEEGDAYLCACKHSGNLPYCDGSHKQFTTEQVRSDTDGIPIGLELSANHIEKDIQFALDAGADYIILDGCGGGTGAAPLLFRDHINVPTIPALARACGHNYMNRFNSDDLATWHREMALLSGVRYAGVIDPG